MFFNFLIIYNFALYAYIKNNLSVPKKKNAQQFTQFLTNIPGRKKSKQNQSDNGKNYTW